MFKQYTMRSESRIISASANISGSITFLILGAISGSVMLLLRLQLFLFSTTESRKRPVFYLSTASVLLGCIEGFMLTHFYVRMFLLSSCYVYWLTFYICSPRPIPASLTKHIRRWSISCFYCLPSRLGPFSCLELWRCGGGNLSTVIKRAMRKNRPIPEGAIWDYFLQILLALDHCHNTKGNVEREQIVHRDLKPENGTFCGLVQ